MAKKRIIWVRREDAGVMLSLSKPKWEVCDEGCCQGWSSKEDLWICDTRVRKMFKGATETPRKYRVTVEEVK